MTLPSKFSTMVGMQKVEATSKDSDDKTKMYPLAHYWTSIKFLESPQALILTFFIPRLQTTTPSSKRKHI